MRVIRMVSWPRATRGYAEHLLEQGEARGQLRSLRRVLRNFLEQNLGQLPDSVLQRIEACNDLQRLERAVFKAPKLAKLEDLDL